jgi:hypothetical protein
MAPATPITYESRDPSSTVLYKVVAAHLETFLASLDADPDTKGLPAYVQREFYDYLRCSIFAHGFLRLGCDTCQKEMLLAFSGKAHPGSVTFIQRFGSALNANMPPRVPQGTPPRVVPGGSSPTPSCGACPASARAALRRPSPCSGALWSVLPPRARSVRREWRRGAPGGALPRTLGHKVLWHSYPPIFYHRICNGGIQ